MLKKLQQSDSRQAKVIQACPSPVKISALQQELVGHPDTSFTQFLISGFINGFDTGFSSLPSLSFECPNLLSARTQPDVTSDLIQSELGKNYLIGPFDNIPFKFYRISPVGVSEGKYSRKKRLIVDLSAPHDNELHPSLNQLIDKEQFSLQYVTIDHAIDIISQMGKGSLLCKTDIKDAFKLVPIKESLWPLHGIKWDKKYYFYTRLVFGSRSSPKIFDNLSVAVCWILQNNYGVSHVLHLLDDFLTIDRKDQDAYRTMDTLISVFNKLGIPLSANKTVGPTTSLEYLGIILDTNKLEARLPKEKVDRISSILSSFSVKKSCTKRELLSLLGHLNFASRVIYPGRAFVSYLLSLSTTVAKLHHHIKLSEECRLDLKMWSVFLQQWNGVSFFLHRDISVAPDFQFYTDATPTGFGGFFNGHWFNGQFQEDIIPSDTCASMAFFELYPIVASAVLWGHLWNRKRILVLCDNSATVEIINKGRSKVPFIMKFMRKLIWTAACNNFVIQAKHIPGKTNLIADALSRFQMHKFRERAPAADQTPTACPPASELTMF